MFTADAYLMTLDPFALRFGPAFGIRWYGLAYLAGILVFYLLMAWFVRRRISPLRREILFDLVSALVLGTLIGGRLGYCILYSPELFISFRDTFPFWGVLALHEGGMASHGGILGIVVAALWCARTYHLSAPHLLDFATLGGASGIFFGRIANFINGELVGRAAPRGYPYGVKFPQEVYAWVGDERERLSGLSDVVALLGTPPPEWTTRVARAVFDPTAHAQVTSTLHRIVDAVQAGNTAVSIALAPHLTTRYPSQLIEALLEGLLLFVILFALWWKPRRPGVIAAMFGVLYPLMRICGEQYRLPDPQIGFDLFGLTRGQWLSIAMLGACIFFLIVVLRRSAERLGGWGTRALQQDPL